MFSREREKDKNSCMVDGEHSCWQTLAMGFGLLQEVKVNIAEISKFQERLLLFFFFLHLELHK